MRPISGSVWQSSGTSLMARVQSVGGVLMQQAAISSISLKVFDRKTETQIGSTESVTVADVVFDTPQIDNAWTRDNTGYNFRYDSTAAQVPLAGRKVRFEFYFTPATGSQFVVPFELDVKALISQG